MRASSSPVASPLTLLAFGIVTGSVVTTQLVLSRVLATTVGYYYAFALVSLAMLGLASGALVVHQLPRLFTPERLSRQACLASLLAALATSLGTVGVLLVFPRLSRGVVAEADLFVFGQIFWCLFPGFFFTGLVVSLVLYHGRERFHVVYGIDLIGGALGCLAAVAALAAFTPVEAALRVGAGLPALAAVTFALGARSAGLAAGAALAAGGLLFLNERVLQEEGIRKPRHLAWLFREPVLSEYDATSNVVAYRGPFLSWALSPTYRGPRFPMLDMLIDGIGGTQIVAFDGDPRSLARHEYLDRDLTALGQRLVPPEGRQLVIGPGGGFDLLQAVRRGRRDVTAVEISPLVRRVVNEDLAEFSGRPYELPGVTVHIENGRTFIKRSDERWDLISLTWVDTGGSATALAASENYLYTVESYVEFLSHLSDAGLLTFTRALGHRELWEADSLRGLSVAVEALARLGVARPGAHLVVAGVASPFFGGRPMCHVLVKRSPFGDAELRRVEAFLRRHRFHALWLPGGDPPPGALREPFAPFAALMREVITAESAAERAAVYANAPLDIAPSTDDNPFYFVERGGPNREPGEAMRLMRRYLVVLGSLVAVFLGVPALPLVLRTHRLGARGAAALAYFALLGLAFIGVEIDLFHVFGLVLGNPTWALAVTLATVLVGSGLGSFWGERLARSSAATIAAAFGVLLLLLGAFAGGREWIQGALVGLGLPARVLGSVAVIAPLAFAMGLPLSTGMTLVAGRRDLVLWGWALNGAFSVLGSFGAVYVAMHRGIAFTTALSLAAYAAAALLLQAVERGERGGDVPPDSRFSRGTLDPSTAPSRNGNREERPR